MIFDKDSILSHLKEFSNKRLLVVGDLILDEFIWGKVRRISPEAPVPVVEVERESLRLGGSANVVNNLIALGAKVSLCGVIGNDDNGKRLRGILDEMQVNCGGVIVKDNRPTAIKTRILAQHQQIVRFDREKVLPVMETTIEKIIGYIEKELDRIDAVILSDYGKGVISKSLLDKAIPLFTKKGIPVAVDPKPVNFPHYQGVTVITPNHHEAAAAAGIDTENEEGLLQTGRLLLEKNRAKAILVTRGEYGMSLFEENGEITHIPTMARDVFDVTGAGDTVIATLTLGLASGMTLKEASFISNGAAGIVVGKLGTATTTPEELSAALFEHP